MTPTMGTRYTLRAAAFMAIMAPALVSGQASLTTLGQPVLIDFFNTVPGVNNGVFGADSDMGTTAPWPGQLDLNAWDYFVDGSPAQAAGNASTFPGTLPTGNGFAEGGSFATGVNATDIDGKRCFGIQPTGGHFTSGNLTLRAVNNTGGSVSQVAIAYDLYIFNDRDRSNAMRLMYSLDNAAGSYVDVPGSQVISPLVLDEDPEWAHSPVQVVISGLLLANGQEFFLRWVGDDVDGAGQRDEIALTHIAITPQTASGPSLAASVTGLPAFAQVVGTPSPSQSFTLSGSALTNEVLLSAPAPFQIALADVGPWLTSIELDPVAGGLPATTVFVRMDSPAPGTATGTLAISSTGANSLVIALSGAASSGSLPTLHINEVMASNGSTIADENGEFDDWIEVFNPNAFPVDLAGWYISDDPANITRYQFPTGGTEAVVPSNGWLLVWADNQSAQGDLHTNFGLSSNGESVILTGPDGVSIVDQIEFPPATLDVSYGRETDGGTPWVNFTVPTPGASNNVTGVAALAVRPVLLAWPNPVIGDQLFLSEVVTAEVFDMSGRQVIAAGLSNMVAVGQLAPGTYVLRVDNGAVLRFVKP